MASYQQNQRTNSTFNDQTTFSGSAFTSLDLDSIKKDSLHLEHETLKSVKEAKVIKGHHLRNRLNIPWLHASTRRT